MKEAILIAGVGNIFFGDDAFGSEVARRLGARSWPANVRVTDFGIRGIDLTFALMDGWDAVVLVDATPRGGRPGSLYVIEPDLEEINGAGPRPGTIETHSMNPMRVLTAARSMGARLGRIFVVGCEPSPESIDADGPGAMGLSDPVKHGADSGNKSAVGGG
jgi:hydrogenase maturation protease